MPVPAFRKQTTIAIRSAYERNFGDYAFYQAKFLSGIHEIRGLPRNRYAGSSVFYNNLELRKSFTRVQNYIVPFDFGMILLTDVGRAWYGDEESDRWHSAVGGGIFINMLDYLAINGTYSISSDYQLFLFGTRFYF